MKKVTLLLLFLVSTAGFSQSNMQKIKAYFDSNRAKMGLTSQDISDLTIDWESTGQGTKITSSQVVQRYQGTPVFNAQSTVWIKEGNVMKASEGFISNIASRVNAVNPAISVIDGITSAYNKVGVIQAANFTITAQKNNVYTISDGIQEDPITAKLVYRLVGESLKLAWTYQFYSPNGQHLLDLRIDAINGSLIDKQDLTINCEFGAAGHAGHNHDFSFMKNAFSKSNSIVQAQGGSYRVIPYNVASPNHGPFELVVNPENALASPMGWHDANNIGGTTAALQFTYTRGNNVLAQEDADGNNGTGIRADGGAGLVFDFPYTGQNSQPTDYTPSATTNLFYTCNIMHDLWYQYGFDEASGNFQRNNYGRGGNATAAGDPVNADAQDGYAQTTPTLNNANFSAPADGTGVTRMQMFLWTIGAPPTNFIYVNTPAAIAGPRAATTNVFEGTDRIPVPVAPNGITADLVHYTNAANPNTNEVSIHNACVVPTNAFDISGKIALIRRGNCNFSNKVKNAQDAGALAAIVYDTVPNNPVRLSMSSTGILGINIPAVFVTKEIGDELVAAMATETVNVKLETPSDLYLYADGDYDNVIKGHEYGHGISGRLVGGAANANCLTNFEQMGEGWSDWFGLMLQLKAGDQGTDKKEIGTYVLNQPNEGFGLRDFPYSTDMSLDPRTLADSNIPVPDDLTDTTYRYTIGQVWTSILWDLTWTYIDRYGFDPDVYTGTGGNNKVMRLVIDALKLQACNTATIVSGRDALIAADQATTGGQDFCAIADVFTRRGVGLNASSGSANDTNDQVEDFTPFPAGPNCLLGVNHFAANDDAFRVYPNPSEGTFNIRINQFVGKVNLQVADINGRIVYTQNNVDFNIEKSVNLNNLQSGMYVLKVSGSSVNYAQKIVIK